MRRARRRAASLGLSWCVSPLAAGRAPPSVEAHALAPLMALSWLAAAFLIVTGFIGANVGMLLWPAAALHLILAVLLTRAWMESRRSAG